MVEVKKIKNQDENLIFFGYDGYEEYYLKNMGEYWELYGLRPNTEEELRKFQRETDPQDMGKIEDWILRYFDYEKFHDEMEEEWYERHDVVTEREENGETYYLGFGSSQDLKNYLKEKSISSYEDYIKNFYSVGFTEKEFDEFMDNIRMKEEIKQLNI